MSAHQFDPTILRAYDIRGIFEDTLTHADAFHIGLTFITMQRARGYGSVSYTHLTLPTNREV